MAVAIHGYHPYSEDGGLYVAGIKHVLHPEYYATYTAFVDANLRYSLFGSMIAALVRVSSLSLPTVLLLTHLASLWSTLFAVWLVAEHTLATRASRSGAVVLFCLCLTVPIAGTSLFLMDPYLSARSLSLPCTLLALAGTLTFMRGPHRRRGALLTAASLLFAALMHPLMAGYAIGATLLLACFLLPKKNLRRRGVIALCVLAVILAGVLQIFAPPEPTGYLPVALSRYYWFLSLWHWYEWLGLVGPLAILAAAAFREGPAKPFARMVIAAGATAILVALLFAHADGSTHLVARLQPLRMFQLVYVVMILILGGLLGERVLGASPWRWIAATVLLGWIFFAVQRSTYPATAHIEWPQAAPSIRWGQAFVWISRNTPIDAVFALDAHYIYGPGEDAQCFRAVAERSALPDYSKDGGEASITPALTGAWTAGQQAQTDLNRRTDAQRLAALHPLNVSWIVLDRAAKTAFNCPFSNAAVQVCRLP